VRLGEELDLLDAPGIIPASFNDQAAAQALAMCNDIGEASYVPSLIAAALLIRIKRLPRSVPALAKLAARYKVHPAGMSGEDFVVHVAGQLFGGDKDQAGVRLLNDFRNGVFGPFALELPPPAAQDMHHHAGQAGDAAAVGVQQLAVDAW
jgi:ribosome biogenesis GTPase A